MKKKLCIFIALVLLAGLISIPPTVRAEESNVRVRLTTEGRDVLTLPLSGTYTLEGTEITGGTLTVAVSGTEVVVTHDQLGALFTGERVTLTAQDRANLFTLATAGGKERTYRGSVTFDVSDGAVRAVNTVGMEDYMLGVAVAEVGRDASEALLKAAMIAAKGYALAEIGVSGSKAYDVDDTSSDQVYNGFYPTAEKAIACAAEVADETLMLDGKPVKTVYSSSNGGAMIKPGGKYDAAYANKFDPFDITRSDATNLMVAVTGDAPATLPQKLYEYLLSKADGDAIVEIADVEGYPQDATPQDGFKITMKVSKGGSVETKTLNVTFAELAQQNVILSDNSVRFAVKVKDGSWLLCWGQSKGHRKGMSQKGAARMAELGYSYVDILKFYYPGAELTRSDGTVVASQADLSTAGIMAAMGGTQNHSITKTLWVAISGAEVMSKASSSADVCARLPFKSRFGVYKQSGDWYFGIDLETGVQGYILKKNVSEQEPADEPTPTDTPAPTDTPEPTPTETPTPTDTPEPTPTDTPEPTDTDGLQDDPNALTEPTAEMIAGAAEGKLTKSDVTMRQGPSAGTTIIASGLISGTEVTVYAEDGDYYFLLVNETNKYGYIVKEFVKLLSALGETSDGSDQPEGTVRGTITSSNLALREGPSVTSKSLGQYYEGKLVYIFYQEGEYYYVQVAGTDMKGYMSAQFIQAESEVPEKPSDPTPTETPEPTPSETPEATETPEPSPSETPEASDTPEPSPSETPEATETPEPSPSETPEATDTPEPSPSETPEATETPEPSPTDTPEPTPTPTPTPVPTPTGPYTEPTEEMIRKAVIGKLVKSGVNMRKGPSTDYDLVDSGLKSGTELTVYLKDGDWYFLKVNRSGKYGYIYKDYVVLENDEPDATPTKKPTEEPAIRLSQGDVNADGLVSAADAALVLRYDAGLMDLSKAKLEAADMDGDGQVTSLDAKAILKYVAGRLAR